MTITELVAAVDAAEDGYDVLRLDTTGDYIGSCPCITIKGEGFRIDGHCWRPGCDQHVYVGLHVSESVPSDTRARMVSLLTDTDWYGEWTWTTEPYR